MVVKKGIKMKDEQFDKELEDFAKLVKEKEEERENNKWMCPICGNRAYQKYGGITMPAVKVDDSVSPPKYEKINYKMGTHFMCKGCSVFFSNPKQFNKVAIDEKKLREAIATRHSIMDIIMGIDKDMEEMMKEIKDDRKK